MNLKERGTVGTDGYLERLKLTTIVCKPAINTSAVSKFITVKPEESTEVVMYDGVAVAPNSVIKKFVPIQYKFENELSSQGKVI